MRGEVQTRPSRGAADGVHHAEVRDGGLVVLGFHERCALLRPGAQKALAALRGLRRRMN